MVLCAMKIVPPTNSSRPEALLARQTLNDTDAEWRLDILGGRTTSKYNIFQVMYHCMHVSLRW